MTLVHFKMEWVLYWPMLHFSTKFHGDHFVRFRAILLRFRQANKQTGIENKLIVRGNDVSFYMLWYKRNKSNVDSLSHQATPHTLIYLFILKQHVHKFFIFFTVILMDVKWLKYRPLGIVTQNMEIKKYYFIQLVNICPM